ITDSPLCAMAVFRSVCNCFLSPENWRATKVAPHLNARAQQSKGGRSLMTPVFTLEPRSAVAEKGVLAPFYLMPAKPMWFPFLGGGGGVATTVLICPPGGRLHR